MKDIKALLEFLYDGSQEGSQLADDFMNLAEQIKTENKIEVKKGPLNKALASFDITVPKEKLVPDYGSVLAYFDTAEEYQSAVDKLESPEGMEKLASCGWVMNIGGSSGENQQYRIRFLALDVMDELPSNPSTKQTDLNQMMKKASDLPKNSTSGQSKQTESKASKLGAKPILRPKSGRFGSTKPARKGQYDRL